MVATVLVDSARLAAGEQLAKAVVHDEEIGARAAAWWLDTDSSEWLFLVATSMLEKEGPKAAFTRIHKILKKSKLEASIELRQVTLTPPENPALRMIDRAMTGFNIDRRVFGTLIDTSFNGIRIAGIHIYHLDLKGLPVRKHVKKPYAKRNRKRRS